MAIFIQGMPCAICGKPMHASSETVALSPFVANRADPLFVLSDAIMHTACFARHPLSIEAERWHTKARQHGRPGERVCAVCNNPIAEPDDYFGTGLLTRDPTSPLFELNFVHLHRSHAQRWGRLDDLHIAIEAAESSGAWQGPKLVFAPTLHWTAAKRAKP